MSNKSTNSRRPVFITLGDPKSINIEILCKYFDGRQQNSTVRPVLIGSKKAWLHQSPLYLKQAVEFEFVDIDADLRSEFLLNEYSDLYRGEVMVKSLNVLRSTMLEYLQLGEPFAVLTLPIEKSSAHKAGFNYAGHTEFMESVAACPAIMTLVSDKMKVGLTTNHLALSQVPERLTANLITSKIKILSEGLQKVFGIARPSIAVCGLNPHCGDSGAFGTEETIIATALEQTVKDGVQVDLHGPVSADTVFYQHLSGSYDAVLAMYHDQGLIPIKTVSFDTAVNVSLGLPFLRVSPDHGPATDIFLQGKAKDGSLKTCFDIIENYFKS